MKKLLFAAAILSSTFFMVSCKSGAATGDPKATLTAFFEALGKKDLATARTLATADSKSMLDLMEMGMKMAKDNTKQMDDFDKSRVDFGDAVVSGDNATVAVKDKKSGESMNFTLKKESGAWKVAFDMGTMMQIGMEKAKQMNPQGMDSLSKKMEDFKNINTDSLKEIMNEGMKSLNGINKDSLKDLMNQGMKSLDSVKAILKEKEKH